MCMFVLNYRLLSIHFCSRAIKPRYLFENLKQKKERKKERTTTEIAWIYRCTVNVNSLKGQTALHCLANKGVF